MMIIQIDRKKSQIASELRKIANEIEAGRVLAVRYIAIVDDDGEIAYAMDQSAEEWGDVLKLQGLSDIQGHKIAEQWEKEEKLREEKNG